MNTIFGFSSYNAGTGYKKLPNILYEHRVKNMNVFTSASLSGLRFLFLNSYSFKLFFLTLFLPEKDLPKCSLAKRLPPSCSLSSFLTFYSVLLSISMPSSIWTLGPVLPAARHIRNGFSGAGYVCSTTASAGCWGEGVGWEKTTDIFKVRNLCDLPSPKCVIQKFFGGD